MLAKSVLICNVTHLLPKADGFDSRAAMRPSWYKFVTVRTLMRGPCVCRHPPVSTRSRESFVIAFCWYAGPAQPL